MVVREAEEPSTKSFMLLNLVSEKQLPCGKLIVSLLSLLNSQGQILRRSSNLHGKRATSLTRFGTLEVHLSYEKKEPPCLAKGAGPDLTGRVCTALRDFLSSRMEWGPEEREPRNLRFKERKFTQRQIGGVDYLGKKRIFW